MKNAACIALLALAAAACSKNDNTKTATDADTTTTDRREVMPAIETPATNESTTPRDAGATSAQGNGMTGNGVDGGPTVWEQNGATNPGATGPGANNPGATNPSAANGSTSNGANATGNGSNTYPPARTDADNTRTNTRDRGPSVTPMDQSNDPADLKITQQIRQKVMGDGSLSFTAKNVKIITSKGTVVLRGPVANDDERSRIDAAAKTVAGASNVINEIEIKK